MTPSFHHFFFPHESNNHKAKALHFSSLLIYLSIFLLIQVTMSVVSRANPSVLGIASDISIDRLLYLTNQRRAESGLNPLKLNRDLSVAAYMKAQDMFKNDYWAHNSPQGKTPWDFILSTKYRYIYAGENLAKDFANSDGVVDAWMKSPSHRDNLLQDRYEDIGFAVVNGELGGEETTLVVQMFGKQEISSRGVISGDSTADLNPLSNVHSAVSEKVLTIPNRISLNPNLDMFRITKALSLYLGLFLLFLMSLDAYYLKRNKTVRLSGHNISHLMFLVALLTAILLTGKGIII